MFNRLIHAPARAMPQPIEVLFLIRSLDYGGAQRQLIELVRHLDHQRFAITVATFYDGGELRPDIERIANIRVVSLHKGHRWDVVPFLWRFGQLVWQVKPQIMHGYMDVANELCMLFGKAIGAQTVSGLRVSNLDVTRYNWAVGLTFRVGAWCSRFADLIIVNSEAGRQYHANNGYADQSMIVIPNGIDIDRFRPDPVARQRMRAAWGVSEDQILIGQVSRFDPMKGHATFLQAAALLVRKQKNVRFVLVGDGQETYKQELHQLARELGLEQHVLWAGPTTQTEAAYNSFDVATLASSYGEGFANVVGEAMACGVPCVVTNVGDGARIVGDGARVVRPEDPAALAYAWEILLDMPAEQRSVLSQQVRERVVQHFSVQQLANTTATKLMELLP